ncbi:MAG: zinc-binding alcohol dehydrogenase family protein [Methanomassiliicoccales archaeon]
MKAMVLRKAVKGSWLSLEDVDEPVPGHDQVRVRVEGCGVCRTDLHIVEGDLPSKQGVIPGHQVVGIVEEVGPDVKELKINDRVGVPWLHSTCGKCIQCMSGMENLCSEKQFTGYSVPGGYAEKLLAREGYVIRLPVGEKTEELAPLLCAGIIGYRALKLVSPFPGKHLAIFGFGSSAHLTLQAAVALGVETSVVSRGRKHLELAARLGAEHTYTYEELHNSDTKFDAAIVFAPAGETVKEALASISPGGAVAVPAVHLDGLPAMDYEAHLFHEKRLFSVEANTRADAQEFMRMASRLRLHAEVSKRPLEEANAGLLDLLNGKVEASLVLTLQ